MTRRYVDTINLGGGLAGAVFDISVGPANVGIIDILLSVGDGALTSDTPLWLRSTGALGGARTLSLDGAEADGSRMVFIDFSNTDIGANNIIVSGSASINGAASITVSEVSQWILFHVGGGIWYAMRQWPQNTVEGAAVRRLTFAAAVWAAGVVDQITVTQSAGPGAGQIGPHGLDVANSYVVQVYDTSAPTTVLIDTEVQVVTATGNITLIKAPVVADFAGTIIIIGDI